MHICGLRDEEGSKSEPHTWSNSVNCTLNSQQYTSAIRHEELCVWDRLDRCRGAGGSAAHVWHAMQKGKVTQCSTCYTADKLCNGPLH